MHSGYDIFELLSIFTHFHLYVSIFIPSHALVWRLELGSEDSHISKIALDQVRAVPCTSEWGTSGEHVYWRRLLDHMIVGRVQPPDGPICVPEDFEETMQAPKWGSQLFILYGSFNLVPLDQMYLIEMFIGTSKY